MNITIRVTLQHVTGPNATRDEVAAQLVEDVASISVIDVEHRAGSETVWADYTIEAVHALEG